MPYLDFNLNDGNEFVVDVLEDRLTIGRDAKNDIVIDNTFISGFHAEFLKQPDGAYELVDLKSSNGTFVNGKRIERSRVKGGDRIMFGQLESRFRERAPRGLAPVGTSKAVSTSKNEPPRIDGRRGDTEGIPARDKEDTPQPSPDTGKIEPTKPVVHRMATSTGDAQKSPPTTGFSLGGALAVHVTKHEDTKDFVSEAWAFNPSPKTWVSGETNRKIWLGAARGEVLSSVRSVFFRWLPGVNNIGAPPDQTAEDFYLIETSGIYGHFRWVLQRNMLHMADYQKAPNNIPLSTEPLEILKRSRFSICKKVLEDSRPES